VFRGVLNRVFKDSKQLNASGKKHLRITYPYFATNSIVVKVFDVF